jgi:hypothetical protein
MTGGSSATDRRGPTAGRASGRPILGEPCELFLKPRVLPQVRPVAGGPRPLGSLQRALCGWRSAVGNRPR